MSGVWEPKYPIDKLPHDLWEGFPEWFILQNDPHALRYYDETLKRVNDWQIGILSDLVALFDWLEKERKEAKGEISVQACYVFQQKLVELLLGCKIGTVKRFLADMGLVKKEVESIT